MRLKKGVDRSPPQKTDGASVSHPICDDPAANTPDSSAAIAEESKQLAAVEDTGSSALAGAAELQDGDLAEKGEPMDATSSASIDEGVEKVRPVSLPDQLPAVSAPPLPISPPPADDSMDVDEEWDLSPSSSLTFVCDDDCAMDVDPDAISGDVEDEDIEMEDCTARPRCGQ